MAHIVRCSLPLQTIVATEMLLRATPTVWHHIILAKQEKLVSNSLANQLGKNRNLAKPTSPRAYMRARIVVAIVVSL
jgi:hypothetical protein